MLKQHQKLPISCFIAILLLIPGCINSKPLTLDQAQLSESTYDWFNSHYGIIVDSEVTVFTNHVLQRLKFATEHLKIDPDFGAQVDTSRKRWRIFVINSAEPNAFSAGNGALFITRGLVLKLKSEAAFAAVISHEMSHELLGHIEKVISKTDLSLKDPTFVFSLEEEKHADSLSLQLLRLSRYDPREAITALNSAMVGAESIKNIEQFKKRKRNLTQGLANLDQFLPATKNSREFTKVCQRLKQFLL